MANVKQETCLLRKTKLFQKYYGTFISIYITCVNCRIIGWQKPANPTGTHFKMQAKPCGTIILLKDIKESSAIVIRSIALGKLKFIILKFESRLIYVN